MGRRAVSFVGVAVASGLLARVPSAGAGQVVPANDAVRAHSVTLGGAGADLARAVAVDPAGRIFVAGSTRSLDFPASGERRGGADVFVLRLDASGSASEWVAVLGGGGDDEATGIGFDPSGSVVVVGSTESADFPVSSGAPSRSHGGGADGFVLRLSAADGTLIGSTCLGGSGEDRIRGVVLGGEGTVFLVGTTNSGDFPTTPGAFQEECAGGRDAFVVKLDAKGGGAIYSTCLGGVREDEGAAIAVDGNGHAYVAGRTDSADFPATTAALDLRKNGVDGFVTKLGLAGQPLFSTFLGGSGADEIRAIAVGGDLEPWVGGTTASDDFPATAEVLRGGARGPCEGFLSRLSSPGSALLWSSLVGGSGEDAVLALSLDDFGTLWAAGHTTSDALPSTSDAPQPLAGGRRDAFLLGIDRDHGDLAFGTFLGGPGEESALGLALLPATESVIVVGSAEASPTCVPGQAQEGAGGRPDALVTRVEPGACGTRAELATLGPGCGADLTVSLARLGRPFRLELRGTSGARGAVLVSEPSASSTPVEGICESHLDPRTTRVLFSFSLDADGRWSGTGRLPRETAWCGRSFALQGVVLARGTGPLSFGGLSQGFLLTVGDR